MPSASTYLTRSATTGTSQKKFTFSFWFKRTGRFVVQAASQWLVDGYGSGSYNSSIYLSSGNALVVFDQASSTTVATSRLFRDNSGWYNAVVAVDTTQNTASDRVKIYINGVQETSFSTSNYPAQNSNFELTGNGATILIGKRNAGDYFNGLMSYVACIDGTAEAPTLFGEVDSSTGEWKIKTTITPTSAWGNNGFLILKDGNTITDQSSNSNDFTLGGGTLTNTEDNPSDVFASINNLDNRTQGCNLSMGNTKIEWHNDNRNMFATHVINKGKYYWEMKYTDNSGGTNAMIGVSLADTRQADSYPGHDATGWSYYADNGQKYNSGGSSYGNTWTINNIIGVAFDADTRTLWFSKDGVWQNSATIAEIGAGTTTNSAWTGMGSAGDWFIPCVSGYDQNLVEFNFGNGYFGTTAISSAGTNASGIGKFEYDVPTNFTALSLKGMNN